MRFHRRWRSLDDRDDIAAEELRCARSCAFVHARVVLAEKPTSAKPGAEALVLPDGTIEGFVGGACAESTVRAQALALLDSGETLLLRITPTAEEPATGHAHGAQPVLVGRHVGDLPRTGDPGAADRGGRRHADRPRPARLAGPLGHAGQLLSDGSLPADAAAVVVASHGRDEETRAGRALRANVPYVGLVASRKRGEAVLAAIDVCGSMKARVHTPAGLDIGARTPEEVALSILAEIISTRPRQSGRPVAEGAPDFDRNGDRPGVRDERGDGRRLAAPRPRRAPATGSVAAAACVPSPPTPTRLPMT